MRDDSKNANNRDILYGEKARIDHFLILHKGKGNVKGLHKPLHKRPRRYSNKADRDKVSKIEINH